MLRPFILRLFHFIVPAAAVGVALVAAATDGASDVVVAVVVGVTLSDFSEFSLLFSLLQQLSARRGCSYVCCSCRWRDSHPPLRLCDHLILPHFHLLAEFILLSANLQGIECLAVEEDLNLDVAHLASQKLKLT